MVWIVDGTKDINITMIQTSRIYILEDDEIKIGFDETGAITEIYDKLTNPSFNLVDNSDIGRYIQVALFYMDGANPTQAGCNSGIKSSILGFNYNPSVNLFYTKIRMRDWGSCTESDITLEQTTVINKNIIYIDYKLVHEGSDHTHSMSFVGGQIPVAYVSLSLNEVQYAKNDQIIKRILPEDRQFAYPDEGWVALTKNDVGITLANFDISATTWEIGKWYNSNPLLLHGLYEFAMPPKWELSWRVYLIVDEVNNAREIVSSLKAPVVPPIPSSPTNASGGLLLIAGLVSLGFLAMLATKSKK